MTAQEKIAVILKRLRREYSDRPGTVLRFRSPFQLLVATILSAQTTDVLVNRVTPELFRKFPTAQAFADTPPERIAQDIRSVNFFNNKAKSIHGAARAVIERFQGTVPSTMAELVTLPGVARKTANIVLSNAFGVNEGIAVDTHVNRLANRLGLTKHADPVKIEQDLMRITPRRAWNDLSHLLIFHGRAVCPSRKPKHEACVLYDLCPSRKA